MNTTVSVASLASAVPVAAATAPAVVDDKAAIVARAQQMVEILGDCFICDGWHEHFDHQRAAEFVDAVRKEDWSGDFADDAAMVVRAWLRDHGQSFEWLYDGYASCMISGAAARSPAAAAIAMSTGADSKLLALGAKLQSLEEEYLALRVEEDQRDARELATGVDEPHPDPDLTRWDSHNKQTFPLANEILAQQPTTLDGLRVFVRAMALVNQELFDDNDDGDPYPDNRLRSFLRALCSCLKIVPAPLQAALLRAGADASTFRSEPVPPAPAVDPIFAAIEAHRKAQKKICVRIKRHSRLEADLPPEKRRTHGEEVVDTDDPRWIAAERAVDKGWQAVDEAAVNLVDIEPTTRAGAIALTNYWAELQAGADCGDVTYVPKELCDDEDPALAKAKEHNAPFGYFIARNAARALERIAA